MTEWAFIFTPVAVLPIVLLFRFLGCKPFEAVDTRPPRYRDYIMGEPNNPGSVPYPEVVPNRAHVVGYWRLLELQGGDTAYDETHLHDGKYRDGAPLDAVPPQQGPPFVAGSEYAPGGFTFQQPSLILMDSVANCRIFTGGYVLVAFGSEYTDEFTIEAWVDPEWGANFASGYEHTLLRAGGRYQRPLDGSAAYHGFSIFANANKRWQVRIGGQDVFTTPPIVSRDEKTHIALTMENDGPSMRARLFLNGQQRVEQPGLSYSRPTNAPLFIGIDNSNLDPAGGIQPRFPAVSRIQEVVLHRKALSAKEIENHFAINHWP